MKQLCFNFFIFIFSSSFFIWFMTACGPTQNDLFEDSRSHGRLDPEAQRRLANPKETAKEHEAEIKKIQDQIKNLENQIDVKKLKSDSK